MAITCPHKQQEILDQGPGGALNRFLIDDEREYWESGLLPVDLCVGTEILPARGQRHLQMGKKRNINLLFITSLQASQATSNCTSNGIRRRRGLWHF